MNLLSLLFSLITTLVTISSLSAMVGVTNCPKGIEYTNAAMKAMKKCNSNIKDYYNKNAQETTRYKFCRGMMILMKCAIDVTKRYMGEYGCVPGVLQKWVFVSTQYIVMNKKQGTCNYKATTLKELIKKLGFESDDRYRDRSIVHMTIPEEEEQCAKAIHEECYPSLVSTSENLCDGVTEFVTKYNNAVTNFPPDDIDACSELSEPPAISKAFAQLIYNFSTALIKYYKAQAEIMCQVDENEIDANYENDNDFK